MSPRRVVIIGGVAAGMSAATRLRRNDERAEIIVLERGEHVSFANCGLPYHLGGVIAERDELLLQTPDALHRRFNLDVRVGHEAVAITPDTHTVAVHNRATGADETLTYDSLIIATGASPFLPPTTGIERALTLRDVADLDAIMQQVAELQAAGAANALLIGGGFIGVELAENLRRRDLAVTIIERDEQILGVLDPELAHPIREHLEVHGVDVRTSAEVVSIGERDALLATDERIPADIVIASIGVRPESALAREAGIVIGARGGIVVDDMQRTSAPDVYAVGDVAEKRDAVSGDTTLVPLAQTANRHGRLVADVITGRDVRALPVLGTAVVGVFDLVAATTGWSEKRLRAAGRSYRAIHTHPISHAGYYPGAEAMTIKLLIDPDTDAILGAQAVGGDGVDKRIDIIATAMRGGITASALADLELAYAPQFGSAKDPVNMLGMVADNLRAGAVNTIQWHELDAALRDGAVLVDLRAYSEIAADGAMPDARQIPLDDLRGRLDELPADRPIIVSCAAGQRGNTAARILTQHGLLATNLDGGYRTWRAGTSANAAAAPAAPSLAEGLNP